MAKYNEDDLSVALIHEILRGVFSKAGWYPSLGQAAQLMNEFDAVGFRFDEEAVRTVISARPVAKSARVNVRLGDYEADSDVARAS